MQKFVLGGLIASLSACSNPPKPTYLPNAQQKIYTPTDTTQQNIPDLRKSQTASFRLSPLPAPADSVRFEDAEIAGFRYTGGELILDVREYILGKKTIDADSRDLAFTGKGQHLHANFDNKIHFHSNEHICPAKMPDGTYDMYCFLSRSYFETVKNPKACFARQLQIRNGEATFSKKLSQATLLYNVPLGDYKQDSSRRIIFDFFLYNTTLSPSGNKISLQVDDNPPQLLDKWTGYYLDGLGIGLHQIKAQLLDNRGSALQTPVIKEFRIISK